MKVTVNKKEHSVTEPVLPALFESIASGAVYLFYEKEKAVRITSPYAMVSNSPSRIACTDRAFWKPFKGTITLEQWDSIYGVYYVASH